MGIKRFAAVALLLCGCAAAQEGPLPREPEPARARAALATVSVDNHSAERVTISYRIAGRPAEVAIGQVAPQSSAVLAPVPAGEPLLLIARTAAGASLSLSARAFPIDGTWTWTIPRNAVFNDQLHGRAP
jgi:hypothetical protein